MNTSTDLRDHQAGDQTSMADADALRNALADGLVSSGAISSAAVQAAFRVVPRHVFAYEVPLADAYADDVVRTKFNADGAAISSVSAPWLQALMLERANVQPGMRILEIGSGGYNAALIAELVGPDGEVTTVDIDADITERARRCLDAAGYQRVNVVLADAEYPLLDGGLFDAILVTVGAWDIPPAWLDQLAAEGVLVLPLRMNGITRSIAFRRTGNHLESTSADVCGFVPIQGSGEHNEHVILLPERDGRHVRLRFDDPTCVPDNPSLLDGALATGRTDVWSGVTIAHRTSWADLYLWCAGFLHGFCQLTADDGTALAAEKFKTWFPYGLAQGDSFACMTIRPTPDDSGVEFGASGYGPRAVDVAHAFIAQLHAWNIHARDRDEPTFAFWPSGNSPAPSGHAATLAKRHGTVTISWPDAPEPTAA